MESDLAQWLVDLGRDHDDQEGGCQVHVPEQQAEAHLHGDDRHRQRRDELQDRTGQEGDPQGLHGGRVVGPAQCPNTPCRADLAAESLERGQSREQVEHLAAQSFHGREALLGMVLGQPADEDHENGDERNGARHGDGGGEVLHQHDQSGQGRHCGGQEELGQVAGEVRLEVVQSASEQGGGVGAVLCLPARSQRRSALQDVAAQLNDRACGGAVGESLLGVEDDDARRHDECQECDARRHRAEGGAGGDDGGDGPRDENCLRDDEQRRHTAGQGGDGDVSPSGMRITHEPGVQGLHGLRIVLLGPWSWSSRCISWEPGRPFIVRPRYRAAPRSGLLRLARCRGPIADSAAMQRDGSSRLSRPSRISSRWLPRAGRSRAPWWGADRLRRDRSRRR